MKKANFHCMTNAFVWVELGVDLVDLGVVLQSNNTSSYQDTHFFDRGRNHGGADRRPCVYPKMLPWEPQLRVYRP
jgi:hypothetical protein